ncbi:hypothetical protein [Agrobacterium vitis]|uniref:DUF2163 domain-containing protein n=1 Tax=Agrobacterium vitis TaxID=373 RepID=A0AAE2RDA2_AGRVI|nr:hypothetical protein [Agrobacterium vitis]MBF2716256.1 hypothetical protein [Agrobacterium vitis]
MRLYPAAITNALAARQLVARDFLWIIARDRTTGNPAGVGFWSDVGNVSAEVVHPDTGNADVRSFYGSGTLISVTEIPLVSTLEAQNVTITMSQIDDMVAQAVRLYDCKQARVEIYRGLFSPQTRKLVSPAELRFLGFIDTIEIKTPAEGDTGAVTLTCASHMQEITRSNPDTRSDASQKLRSSTDNFYQDTAVVGDWELFWGQTNGKISTSKTSSMADFLKNALAKNG